MASGGRQRTARELHKVTTRDLLLEAIDNWDKGKPSTGILSQELQLLRRWTVKNIPDGEPHRKQW
jgi:hypothetical protein